MTKFHQQFMAWFDSEIAAGRAVPQPKMRAKAIELGLTAHRAELYVRVLIQEMDRRPDPEQALAEAEELQRYARTKGDA